MLVTQLSLCAFEMADLDVSTQVESLEKSFDQLNTNIDNTRTVLLLMKTLIAKDGDSPTESEQKAMAGLKQNAEAMQGFLKNTKTVIALCKEFKETAGAEDASTTGDPCQKHIFDLAKEMNSMLSTVNASMYGINETLRKVEDDKYQAPEDKTLNQ